MGYSVTSSKPKREIDFMLIKLTLHVPYRDSLGIVSCAEFYQLPAMLEIHADTIDNIIDKHSKYWRWTCTQKCMRVEN